MTFVPPYSVPYEQVMAFISEPRFVEDLALARSEYFSHTGDVSEEHQSYDSRVLAFLDWYALDRAVPELGKSPVQALADDESLPFEQREALRTVSRTIHGLFELRRIREDHLVVRNLVEGDDHRVVTSGLIPGLEKGDIFETRLVPWADALHFSPALLHHPRPARRAILKGVKRLLKEGAVSGRELVWTVSRMAARAENYRSVSVDQIYDFENPPPVIREPRIRCDPASVAARRWGAVEPLPIPEDELEEEAAAE